MRRVASRTGPIWLFLILLVASDPYGSVGPSFCRAKPMQTKLRGKTQKETAGKEKGGKNKEPANPKGKEPILDEILDEEVPSIDENSDEEQPAQDEALTGEEPLEDEPLDQENEQMGEMAPEVIVPDDEDTFTLFASEIDCTSYRAFSGEQRYVPGLPDRFSRYDSFQFDVQKGNWEAVRLDGEFPYARYYSVSIYDAIGGRTILSMADFMIEPLPGNTNPFRPGAERYSSERSFEIFLVPEGGTTNATSLIPETSNSVNIPEDVRFLNIIVRVYRADEGFDNFGGVPPARVVFVSNEGPSQCPFDGAPNSRALSPQEDLDALLDLIFFPEDALQRRQNILAAQGEKLIFTRADGTFLYQNPDNQYVFTALSNSEISIFQVRLPTFPNTYNATEVFEGGTDVRYFSVCVGGLGLSLSSNCLLDEDITVDDDGIATIVIAPQRFANITRSSKDLNFLPRGLVVEPLVIVRHLLEDSNFEGKFTLAPVLPLDVFSTNNTEEIDSLSRILTNLDVKNFIGDFGPSGFNLDSAGYLRFVRRRNLNI